MDSRELDNHQMLELLIKYGGNINHEIEGGITPLHMAINDGNINCIEMHCIIKFYQIKNNLTL